MHALWRLTLASRSCDMSGTVRSCCREYNRERYAIYHEGNDSQSSNVGLSSTNVKWATFEVRAAGENIKVEALEVVANQTAAIGMDNAKVFLNGVQVGPTKDLVDDANPDVRNRIRFRLVLRR